MDGGGEWILTGADLLVWVCAEWDHGDSEEDRGESECCDIIHGRCW